MHTKRGSKGQEIKFITLETSECLLPFNSGLNIEEKRRMFNIRNRMTVIPYNFGKKEEKCICGEIETMQHIYSCNIMNQSKTEISYNLLYNGNLKVKLKYLEDLKRTWKQAGAELGQAQLKLRLDINQIQYTFAFSLFDLVELVGWA